MKNKPPKSPGAGARSKTPGAGARSKPATGAARPKSPGAAFRGKPASAPPRPKSPNAAARAAAESSGPRFPGGSTRAKPAKTPVVAKAPAPARPKPVAPPTAWAPMPSARPKTPVVPVDDDVVGLPDAPVAAVAPAAPPVPRSKDTPGRITLLTGRERSAGRGHPWVFSGAVGRVDGEPGAGDTVEMRSAQGGFLGWAAYSPESQIRARVWDFHESARIDAAFFAERVRWAVKQREDIVEPGERQAARLIHGEADGLPGVVADRFADHLVVQFSSAGAWRWRDEIVDALVETTGIAQVFERSDAEVLALEGLESRVGPVRGEEPAGPITIEESGLLFEVDVRHGHKTGFYLDQRDNRAMLRDLVEGREVLDCFCYTGGFTVNALAGGAASVVAVDSSGEALAAARRHVALNNLPEDNVEFVEADVFALLRKLRDQGRSFDAIVLDPPKFAPTAAMAERAARGYKDINLWALKLLRPGGLLFTYSCSGGITREFFQKVVAGAAADAGASVRLLHHMGAAADHPVSLAFPEGEYLKGLLCQVV